MAEEKVEEKEEEKKTEVKKKGRLFGDPLAEI